MNPIFATDSWQSFMEAIRANPLDDLPRLVSADWLDETGDKEAADFATFIRLGCEIGEMKAKGLLNCKHKGLRPVGTLYTPVADLETVGQFTKHCRCRPCSLRRREWARLRGHKTWNWTLEAGKPMAMWEENLRKRVTFPWHLLAANYTGPAEPRQEEIPFPHFFAEFDRGFIYRCRPTMAVWIQYGAMAVRGPFACVERVIFSDRRPSGTPSGWFWGGASGLEYEPAQGEWTYIVPKEIWRLCREPHKSSEDAVSALSTAALKWAWSQTPPE